MAQYSIKDLEKLSGIKAHTIRIWEQRYGLIVPQRTQTNIRYYDDDQLKFILNVSLLSKNGFKISQISGWDHQEFSDKVSSLYEETKIHTGSKHYELGANDLVGAMIDMDIEKFQRIYESSVRQVGFMETIVGLIYPFLEKVGVLWTIDKINPAHEHLISCLIRQKIITAIDQLEESKKGRRFLLFLPEGEYHEVGLLLAHYILKSKGAWVYYLGQSLPLGNIGTAVKTVKPEYVLTFMVDPAIVNNGIQVLEEIKSFCPETKILVATRKTEQTEQLRSEHIVFLHEMEQLSSFV
jgi:MerR family transcriptional regulator, light-induced transcriptional regulator